ncbi:hypothetical protein DFH06DRAFT_1411970 [Mycena polygramma]|nr:hypothetical protein DFH06DRAFT_1411970 [Mycena polygramma]
MSDFNFTTREGIHIVPTWSTKNGAQWCSLNASASKIDPAASLSILTILPPRTATTSLDTMGILRDPNFLEYAAIYSPTEHYLGWMPTKALTDATEDPIALAFDANPIPLYEHYTDVQRAGGSDDSGSPIFIGYYLDEKWVERVTYLSGKLRTIVVDLAMSTDYYGPSAWVNGVGDLPEEMDYQLLRMFQTTTEEADRMSTEGRRSLLAFVAFISWFVSVCPTWRDALDSDDYNLVESLRLGDRLKRGILLKLSRDYHETTVTHWLENDVGCHYIWTEEESSSGRFVRYSPEFWAEYMALRMEAIDAAPLDLRLLPSFQKWEENIDRYDIFFQDKKMGRPGEIITDYNPTMDYRVVDHLHYGARPLENWHVIRAYSEKMKAKIVRSKIPNASDVCTFYRQNPIPQNDHNGQRGEHRSPLTDFAPREKGVKISEEEAYFESDAIIRERVKNRYAPRPDRYFNNFNGGPDKPGAGRSFSQLSLPASSNSDASGWGVGREHLPPRDRAQRFPPEHPRPPVMSPTRRSERTEDKGISTRWLEEMTSLGSRLEPRGRAHRSRSYSPRRRSSRSASPPYVNRGPSSKDEGPRGRSLSRDRSPAYRSEASFDDEFQGLTGDDMEAPPSPSATPPLTVFPSPEAHDYNRFTTRGEAVAALMAWVEKMAQLAPPSPDPGTDWYWALLWLDHSYLVLKDPRASVYLKMLAACTDAMDMIGVLNLAIRYGIPFGLYVKASAVREFRERNMTDLERNTLSALYAPGYVDECIPYTIGGVAAYGKYLATIGNLLNRPHATAFIYAGGILSFIATFYNPDLIRRLMGGPSMQVTQFNRGDTVLLKDNDDDVFLVSDCVSPSEVSMLIGHVPTGNSSTETSLWPHPSLLEKESGHVHGIWTTGYYAMLENLKGDLAEGHYRWRTHREWKAYFHGGNRGTHAPPHVASAADFREGADLLRRSFPADWNLRPTLSIGMPEKFTPIASLRTARN